MSSPNFLNKNYKNILDYIYQYGSFSFAEKGFTDVDALVFSAFTYIPFENFVSLEKPFKPLKIQDACLEYFHWLTLDYFRDNFPDWMQKSLFLALALVKSKRYSECLIKDFTDIFSNKKESQFAALDIQITERDVVVAYRGTDTSITGWKEDFNLCYQSLIPSQSEALTFLNEAFCRRDYQKYNFFVCGHSKGGNLACYAASYLDEEKQKSITKIYSFDGPGQVDEVFDFAGHKKIVKNIVHIVPQDCVIGALLNHEKISYVVEAADKGNLVSQHDCYTWKINDDSFVKLNDRTPFSHMLENTFNEWLNKRLNQDEREGLVNSMFDVIIKTGVKTSDEVFYDSYNFILKFLRRLNKEEKSDRAVLKKALKSLMLAFKDSIPVYNNYQKQQKQSLKLAKRSA